MRSSTDRGQVMDPPGTFTGGLMMAFIVGAAISATRGRMVSAVVIAVVPAAWLTLQLWKLRPVSEKP